MQKFCLVKWVWLLSHLQSQNQNQSQPGRAWLYAITHTEASKNDYSKQPRIAKNTLDQQFYCKTCKFCCKFTSDTTLLHAILEVFCWCSSGCHSACVLPFSDWFIWTNGIQTHYLLHLLILTTRDNQRSFQRNWSDFVLGSIISTSISVHLFKL